MTNNNLSFNSNKEISTGRSTWLMRLALLLGVVGVLVPSMWLFQKFMQTEFAKSITQRSNVEFAGYNFGPGGISSSDGGSSIPVGNGSSGVSGRLPVGNSGGTSALKGGVNSSPGTSTVFKSQCLARSGQKVIVPGLQKQAYGNYSLRANTVIDASSARWDGTTSNGVPIAWAIIVQGLGPSCWYGGNYNGAWDDTNPAVTWQNSYHHSGGLTIRVPDFLVESLRVNNQGDGVRMESAGSNFFIRGVHLSNIHDDCIENDFLHAGTLDDSLLDGCYVGFSADDHTATLNGSANTWQITNNLVYIKRMNTVYTGPKPASGMLFKGWYRAGVGPSIILKNNIFMADDKAGLSVHSSGATLGVPPLANLKNCENNIFVWLGKGPFPNALPSCFRVTTDASVWNNAVAQWKNNHPGAR